MGCEECEFGGRAVEHQRSAAEMADIYLQQVESCWLAAKEGWRDDGACHRSRGNMAAQRAAAYAALAQAEAQSRIAIALEDLARPGQTEESHRKFRDMVDLYRRARPT